MPRLPAPVVIYDINVLKVKMAQYKLAVVNLMYLRLTPAACACSFPICAPNNRTSM